MKELKAFLKKHDACASGARWAIENCTSLYDLWDKLPGAPNKSWMMWVATRPGVFSDKDMRLLACRIVRTTPVADGKTVWDLLTGERPRSAVEISERYAVGLATYGEVSAAAAAARDAARAAARANQSVILEGLLAKAGEEKQC